MSLPITAPTVARAAAQTSDVAIQLAQLSTERTFEIAAQPLTTALTLFGQQSGLQVTVHGTLPRDISAPAVRGTMTNAQALNRLLSGSGLIFVVEDETTVAIERPPEQDDDVLLLDPLVVEGRDREDPRGPVEGYRATRSVTGTRLDVLLDEQPLPIQVLPRDVIEDAGATRLDDIVRLSTSGAIGNSRGGTQEFFTIRGFDASVVRNGAGTFGLAQQTDTANVERVEVLRGPGSALYGEGAPGGVINVITKRPDDSFFVEASSEASSLIRLRQELDVNLPLEETWDLNARVVGALEGTDSFRFRDDYDETFAEDRQFLAPSLSFSPTPTTDVLVSGEYLRSSDVFDRGVPLNDDGSLAADVDDFFGDPDVGNIESETLGAQLEVAQEITDGLSLRLFGSAVRNDFEGLSLEPNVVSPLNLDAATAAALGLPGPLVAGDTILRIIRNRDLRREVYSFQSDLNGSVSFGPVTQDLLFPSSISRWRLMPRSSPQTHFWVPTRSLRTRPGPQAR
ncbi:TonB-dependent siderophore receptor [Algihabitans sp.]|uniref:TonB-dependent siderophore receptor n=1 Tax=Algihabitans sp. TaxID=2821514 RepID=UPI003BA891CC